MSNTIWVKQAFDELNIKYNPIGASENLMSYTSKTGKQYFFIGGAIPVNSHSFAMICKDKGYTYTLLNNTIAMPKTIWIYDPDGISEKRKSYEESLEVIHDTFSYPLIIKMNKGTMGKHIYKCQNITDTENALRTIFTRDKNYDFMALAQEYIHIEKEYRVVIYDNKVEFVYLKDNHEGIFVGNFSPLHFDNSKAVHIYDTDILEEINKFVVALTSTVQLPYNGLDLACDDQGKYRLIELNGSPQFKKYVNDNGEKAVVEMNKKIILNLI